MFESNAEMIWLAIGFAGQGLFFMRFFVQWIVSEKEKRSVIPTVFWYFSLAGGMTLFAYAIWRHDPVFIVGQGAGLFIYTRNLMLLRQEKSRTHA
ncbi:MAG: lipid-A-disaccharide synthase N-terminal domain-containing protein [Proteobacteria bacterium]|nr:lipid-A-disaccharide synthase N-terminal domain-containing protein [Pseudomonadota bacterium]